MLTTLLLLLAAPAMVLIAIALRLAGGHVLFAQVRVGRGGVAFLLLKFRTLDGDGGATVATSADPRSHRLGRWLRRWHVDELPQLWNVLRGDMALVGPRPEVPANLTAVDPGELALLRTVRPGLTGPTQLAFLAEDEVLAEVPDPVATYRSVLVPAKVRSDLQWLARRSWAGDLLVLLRTPLVLLSPTAHRRSRQRVRALLAAGSR